MQTSAMEIAAPSPPLPQMHSTPGFTFPALTPIDRPDESFVEHVKQLVHIASRSDIDGTNWLHRFGAECKLAPRQRLSKVLHMHEALGEKIYPTMETLLPALIAYSTENRPQQLTTKRMKQFEALLWNTPCSKRVPSVIRNENMFERCGITLLLYRNLSNEIAMALQEGSLAKEHFGPAVRYQAGQRTNTQKGTGPPGTPLSRAIETAVRGHLEDPCILEFVRLLGGVWPYSSSVCYGATYWFDVIMNHICCFINNGSFAARLKRSRAVILGAATQSSEPIHSMADFQHIGSSSTAMDLFITGIGESRHQWGAHGNTERFGSFVQKSGEGTYAVVARCVNRTADAYGRTEFALRAQTFYLLMNDHSANEEEQHNSMCEVLAGTCIARALTESVCPYDGYVKTDGSVHAASIARLLDHQMVLGELGKMVPGLEHRLGRHKNVRPWQLEVLEYVNGVKIDGIWARNVMGNGATQRGHNWYCAIAAHAAATLRSFEGMQFTHADLTFRNMMVSHLPERLRSYAKCVVYQDHRNALGNDIYIPLEHTNNWLIKVIDFSLSSLQSDKYGHLGREPCAMRMLKTYHPAFDLHMLGCWMLFEVAQLIGKVRWDAPAAEQYGAFQGVTSATVAMMLDMLMPSHCTVELTTSAMCTETFSWSNWVNAEKKSVTKVISQETANELYETYLRTLRKLGNTVRISLGAYEANGHMPNFGKSTLVNDMSDAAQNASILAYYCTFASPRSLSAHREFLLSKHFGQYRTPMKEGVLIMNEPA